MTHKQAWLAWYMRAEVAYDRAVEHQRWLWECEHKVSEGYLEAVERTAQARTRWEARLTALNAYFDWQAKA